MELNPEQQKILTIITKIWEANPSLRFLQLIGNCFGPTSLKDIYFIGDDDLKKCLEYTYAWFTDLSSGYDAMREEDQERAFEEKHGDQSRLSGD